MISFEVHDMLDIAFSGEWPAEYAMACSRTGRLISSKDLQENRKTKKNTRFYPNKPLQLVIVAC